MRNLQKTALDFIQYRVIGKDIIPIEVKAGKSGRLKSLEIFMQEHDYKFGIQLSTQALHREGKLLKIPLYLTSEIQRLGQALA